MKRILVKWHLIKKNPHISPGFPDLICRLSLRHSRCHRRNELRSTRRCVNQRCEWQTTRDTDVSERAVVGRIWCCKVPEVIGPLTIEKGETIKCWMIIPSEKGKTIGSTPNTNSPSSFSWVWQRESIPGYVLYNWATSDVRHVQTPILTTMGWGSPQLSRMILQVCWRFSLFFKGWSTSLDLSPPYVRNGNWKYSQPSLKRWVQKL